MDHGIIQNNSGFYSDIKIKIIFTKIKIIFGLIYNSYLLTFSFDPLQAHSSRLVNRQFWGIDVCECILLYCELIINLSGPILVTMFSENYWMVQVSYYIRNFSVIV